MSEGPVYDHDCTRCRFLGSTGPTPGYPKANAVDHYACENVGGVTMIQRGGSRGPDYLSVPVVLLRGEPLSQRWGTTLTLYEGQPQNSLAFACA